MCPGCPVMLDSSPDWLNKFCRMLPSAATIGLFDPIHADFRPLDMGTPKHAQKAVTFVVIGVAGSFIYHSRLAPIVPASRHPRRQHAPRADRGCRLVGFGGEFPDSTPPNSSPRPRECIGRPRKAVVIGSDGALVVGRRLGALSLRVEIPGLGRHCNRPAAGEILTSIHDATINMI